MANFLGFLVGTAYWVGSLVCHQLPERSFFLAGRQLPVCARCTGLYVSGLVGLAVWLAVRRGRGAAIRVEPRTARDVLVVAALPTLVSVASGALGAWDGTNLTRALLAIPFGLAGGAIVAAVATKDLR